MHYKQTRSDLVPERRRCPLPGQPVMQAPHGMPGYFLETCGSLGFLPDENLWMLVCLPMYLPEK